MPLGFKKYQINNEIVLVVCALVVVVIPVFIGLLFLNRSNRNESFVQAAPVVGEITKCDLNSDLVVDDKDYEMAVASFGKAYPGSVDKSADIDGDGWVNSLDLEAISTKSAICLQ